MVKKDSGCYYDFLTFVETCSMSKYVINESSGEWMLQQMFSCRAGNVTRGFDLEA